MTNKPIVSVPRPCESLGGYKPRLQRTSRLLIPAHHEYHDAMSQPNRLFCLGIALFLILPSVAALAAEGHKTSPAVEKEQLAILRSNASAADKAIACKKLAIDGSTASVPDLAKLLSDPQLASWSRIALEAIPGPEADLALRTAAESLEGELLVGVLNSIGVRRDEQAVAVLATRLNHPDTEVAAASAVALGKIGSAGALAILRPALATGPMPVRSAVAEGCILCAERLDAAGNSAEAAQLYDAVRKAAVPKQRLLEATRGAILARRQEGLPLLVELLRAPDRDLFRLSLTVAREFPGDQIDRALAEQLGQSSADRAALILQAMADRKETVVVPAIVKAASQGPKNVRLSALNALGRVGDASCLAGLLEIAVDPDADLAQAAKATLADLQGEKVDAQIASLLPGAKGKSYPLLIELVGQRRIEATPALIKALESKDPSVRAASLRALGETVALKELPVLIGQAVAPKQPEDAATALAALKAAAVRMPDREACASELSVALDRSPAKTRLLLLEILGEVGGTKAMHRIAAAAKSDDGEMQDAGSRLLGKWNSVDAAPVLLDLAKTGPAAQFRTRALRGYIGLARKFAMPEEQRVEMCQNAFALARPAEQKLVLDVIKLHPSEGGLKLAIKALETPDLKDEATQATLSVAQKLAAKGADVSSLLSTAGLGKMKLEITKAEYGAGTSLKDVTEVVQKRVGSLPIIELASANYNESFGDPAPGSVKQLKIQYRINGKTGEASFPENAVIILPMPK